MDQVEQSWYPGWGELPYREYNDTILPRDAPGIGFNISESILDSINEIKQLPKDLVIPNEDKSRILDEKTYQINEKTKLKIFFSDAKNDYQTGDIIFANASNSYTSFPNPKMISTAYAINLENYKTKSYIGRYCEYITNIVIELIALAKTHGFTNISFDDAFCSEVYGNLFFPFRSGPSPLADRLCLLLSSLFHRICDSGGSHADYIGD